LFLEYPSEFQSAIFRGRLIVSVFAILGTVVCFLWGRKLSNGLGGLCTAMLWGFQPQILGHGSLITNDVPVAVMMLTSAYLFTRWLECRTVPHAIGLGFVFGISLLCKFTALLLIPLFVMFIILATGKHQWKATLFQTGLCLIVCWSIVCIPYRFAGVTQSLGDFEFISTTLNQSSEPIRSLTGNRFRGTVLEKVPGMVPAQYLQGLDRQQFDFNHQLSSYARGMNQTGSWWWFYLYAMVVKLPLGTWLAITAGLCATVQKFRDFDLSDGFVATSAIFILFVISTKEGIGQQVRYVLPAYPFVFVLVANVFSTTSAVPYHCFEWKNVLRGSVLVGCLSSVGATLLVAPDWLPFFNQGAGGSLAGYRHLYNDATDWGQSRYDVAVWLRSHPHERPAFLISDTIAGDNIARMDKHEISVVTSELSTIPEGDCWLIVSQTSMSRQSNENWLWHQTPVDSIHATYLIYKVEGRQWRKHLNAVPEFWRVPNEIPANWLSQFGKQ
jgi:4-amino-4-deoxy-L-arabinose transferase-like glycosyltransferase